MEELDRREQEKLNSALEEGPPGFLVDKKVYGEFNRIFDEKQKSLYFDTLYEYSMNRTHKDLSDPIVNAAVNLSIKLLDQGINSWVEQRKKVVHASYEKQRRAAQSNHTETASNPYGDHMETNEKKGKEIGIEKKSQDTGTLRGSPGQHKPLSSDLDAALKKTCESLTPSQWNTFCSKIESTGFPNILSPDDKKTLWEDKLLYWLQYQSREDILSKCTEVYEAHKNGKKINEPLSYITTSLRHLDGWSYEDSQKGDIPF